MKFLKWAHQPHTKRCYRMSDKIYMTLVAAATYESGTIFVGLMFAACTKILEISLAGA